MHILFLNTDVFFPENTMFTHHIPFISYIINFHSSIYSLSISISTKLTTLYNCTISYTILQSIMHKDVYQSLITSHIQFIKQQSKVLTYYFRTPLLKSGQLITSNQDK